VAHEAHAVQPRANSRPAAGAPASSTKAATTTTAKPVAGVKTATASYCNRKETRSAACRSEEAGTDESITTMHAKIPIAAVYGSDGDFPVRSKRPTARLL
jgi:hypothetical protein